MRKLRSPEIREILLQHEYGLTAKEIATYTNMAADSVTKCIKTMSDVYIDRWSSLKKGLKYMPVYIAIKVPEDCPKP
jgi:hypothetical protein